jgi:hypothetical protein
VADSGNGFVLTVKLFDKLHGLIIDAQKIGV